MLWAETKGKTIIEWPLNANQLRVAIPDVTLPATNAELETLTRIEGPDGRVFLGVEPASPPLPTQPLHKVGVGAPAWNSAGDGLVRTFIEQPRADEEIAAKWAAIRVHRKKLLSASDWTQMPDVTLEPNAAAAVAAYRQALRDITSQADPFNLAWPTPPQK